MHMTTKISLNNETPNQFSIWSYCLAIVSVFALADVFTGGQLRESVTLTMIEYVAASCFAIALFGVYASDGISGARFVRSYSRHKL